MKMIILAFILSSMSFAKWSGGEFRTQLKPDLYIGGIQCPMWALEVLDCKKHQWLITVDAENMCFEDGSCTAIDVPPFVAELVRADVVTPSTISLYSIRPVAEVPNKISNILNKYWVKFDLNSGVEVIEK